MHDPSDQRNATATVHAHSLNSNLKQVQHFAPHSRILAMVKANGYGHGIRATVSALKEADGYGVASLSDAFEIKDLAVDKIILLMGGFFNANELQQITQNNFSIVIHSIEQITYLQHQKLSRPLKIWLKVDTGMHRLGFLSENSGDIIKTLESMPVIEKPFVIMSHFACSDESEHPLNKIQLNKFHQIVADYPHHQFSMANSAAIISCPKSHFDWVRPGIMLYGISPLSGSIGRDLGLIPAMELKAQLIEKKIINKNEPVGYGASWISPEKMSIGIVALGYGDGYPRHATSGTPTLVRKKICPLIGRVSMDFCCIDLRNCDDAKVGDEVTLWGKELPIEHIAEKANTIAYELITKMTERVGPCYD